MQFGSGERIIVFISFYRPGSSDVGISSEYEIPASLTRGIIVTDKRGLMARQQVPLLD
jgi:hypothetical protein